MVNHPLHRLYVPLFCPFTYYSLIWLNNSLVDIKNNIPQFVEINYTFPNTGYCTIPYPSGYTKDNCFIVSYMSYNANLKNWSEEAGADQGICRLFDDNIKVYKQNGDWTKCKLILGKM